MAGFLAGIGAALTEGSSLSARARAERRQADLDRQQREMELARMALERRRADLSEQSFEAEQGDREYGRVKDILSLQAPGTEIDDTLGQRADKVGLGIRLSPAGEMTLPSTQFAAGLDGGVQQVESPAVGRARIVLPTFEQEGVIADRRFQSQDREFQTGQRETQRRAQEAVNQPGFWAMPETQRAVVWGQTGFGGQIPMSFDEWKKRENYQHNQQLQRIGAQAAAFSPQRTEWVVRNGVPTPINSTKDYLPGDRPYDPVADRNANKGAGNGLDFGQIRGQNIKETIGRLRGDTVDAQGNTVKGNRIGRNVVGWGSLLSSVPETDAAQFASDVESLKSNIIQKSLQEMRDASKTGGALGQVSDFENRLLAQSLGALNTIVRPEDFSLQLDEIEKSLLRWEEAKARFGPGARPTDGGAGLNNNVHVAPGQVPGQGGGGELDCSQRDPRTGKLVCR